jgi:segregation and condensation protein B
MPTRDSSDRDEHNEQPVAPMAPVEADAEDEESDELEGLDPTASIQAVLLAAHEPLNANKLASLTGAASAGAVRQMVRDINRVYAEGGRSFYIRDVAGGYLLMTRPAFARWLRKLHVSRNELRLSEAAMETLAIVAYRQPALRAEVEEIRGVQASEMLRQLMEKGLVKIAGRDDTLGRPILYGTTRQFLERFGLRSLDDLPRAEELRETLGDADMAPPPPEEDEEDTTDEDTDARTDTEPLDTTPEEPV